MKIIYNLPQDQRELEVANKILNRTDLTIHEKTNILKSYNLAYPVTIKKLTN